MKPIKIKPENKDKINAAIREIEGRASERTADFEDVVRMIRRVESRMGVTGSTRKNEVHKIDLEGLRVEMDPNAQRFHKAYKYKPMSTHIDLAYRSGAWMLIYAERRQCTETECTVREFPETLKNAIIRSRSKW